MATRKNATKTSKRAELDADFVPFVNSKKSQKKANKTIKSAGAKTLVIALVVLVVGALVGCLGGCFLTKNDCFEIIGNDEINLTIGETYTDQGIKAVAFGKDCSNDVEIETNLLIDEHGNYYSDEIGTFYIKYKVKNIKYNSVFKVQKVRLVTFVEASEGGE